jgi:methionyl-tRNA formyltransferase
MKIVVAGFGSWAVPAIAGVLRAGFEAEVVTYRRDDIPMNAPLWIPLETWCAARGIHCVLDTWPPEYKWATSSSDAMLISSNWRHKFPTAVCEAFGGGAFNVHRSLLPDFKGIAPVNRAIADGARTIGVSLHRLSEEWDSGELCATRAIDIPNTFHAIDAVVALEPVVEAMVATFVEEPRYQPGVLEDSRVDVASTAPPNFKDLTSIDWNMDAQSIVRLVRAWSWPFPGAHTTLSGRTIIIEDADFAESANRVVGAAAGYVEGITEDGSALIRAGTGLGADRDSVRVKRLRDPDDTIRRHPGEMLFVGDRFGS